jgi:hypothetical protein
MPENRSKHHGWMPDGTLGIAVNPYRLNGGISAILALSASAGVNYDAGYPCGAMFIDYPEDLGDVALIDQLINDAYTIGATQAS